MVDGNYKVRSINNSCKCRDQYGCPDPAIDHYLKWFQDILFTLPNMWGQMLEGPQPAKY